MNLHALLLEREAAGRPVTVGLIGAGKFGTMFLAQVRRTRGMHLVGIADLSAERAAQGARLMRLGRAAVSGGLARRRVQERRARTSRRIRTR